VVANGRKIPQYLPEKEIRGNLFFRPKHLHLIKKTPEANEGRGKLGTSGVLSTWHLIFGKIFEESETGFGFA
jgi:hypothetical protein